MKFINIFNFKNKNNKFFLLLFNIILISIYYLISFKKKNIKSFLFSPYIKNKEGFFEIDINQPENYERIILDKIAYKLKNNTLMSIGSLYFINGLIRKYRPRKILEIGVCSGGVSATILNAIKDIEGSMLYSCDLETKHYTRNYYEVGYAVKKYFPEFLYKWVLFTGNTTAAFIEKIGFDIDFVFIDTAHVMPGEVLNVIEILPFLKKNAIIAFDDIHHHAITTTTKMQYFHSSNNLLMSVLRGKKILFGQKKNQPFKFTKLGAIILEDRQDKYFFEYFYLLSNNWSYMPNEFEINTIRKIVEKYYKPFFLSIFDLAVKMNYEKLKKLGLLQKDYILYTFPEIKRKKPIYK